MERHDEAPSPALAPPPGNPRFPLFDGLRGIAVLGILAFHSAELTARVGTGFFGRAAEVFGSVVPTLFFVISGFLLYRPYVSARVQDRPPTAARRYARRRALRILPAFWVALTLLAIYPGITGVFSSDWWRYYGYMQLYSARTRVGGIAVAWTLCVEVTFYIALPIWAWAVRRLPRGEGVRGMLRGELVVLALVAVGGIAVQLAAAKQLVPYALGISIVGQATWLCLGMALAVLSVGSDHDSSFRGLRAAGDHAAWCWVVSALAFFGLIALVPSGGLFGLLAQTQSLQGAGSTLAHIVLSAVFVTLLVLPAIFDKGRTRVPHRLLGLVPLVWLGTISYSFYLFHLTIAQLIAWPSAPGLFSASGLNLLAHVHTLRTVVLFTVTLVVTAVVAAISYRLVELPFLRHKEDGRGGGRGRLSILGQR